MKEDFERIQKMIESDRFGFVNGSKEIIRSDIEELLSQYFYLPEHVKIELIGSGEKFDLSIKACDCRLRSFNVLK